MVDRYFTWTASRIEGVGLDVLARETQQRHDHAFKVAPNLDGDLEPGGQYQWRRRGEHHMYNPNTVALLQHAVRAGSYKKFKEFTAAANDESRRLCTIRGPAPLPPGTPIPLDEVEPATEIASCTPLLTCGCKSARSRALAVARKRSCVEEINRSRSSRSVRMKLERETAGVSLNPATNESCTTTPSGLARLVRLLFTQGRAFRVCWRPS